MLNPKRRIFLDSKIILTGRPHSCDTLMELYSDTKLKAVDIIGFSEKVVDDYIKTFFGNDNGNTNTYSRETEGEH